MMLLPRSKQKPLQQIYAKAVLGEEIFIGSYSIMTFFVITLSFVEICR